MTPGKIAGIVIGALASTIFVVLCYVWGSYMNSTGPYSSQHYLPPKSRESDVEAADVPLQEIIDTDAIDREFGIEILPPEQAVEEPTPDPAPAPAQVVEAAPAPEPAQEQGQGTQSEPAQDHIQEPQPEPVAATTTEEAPEAVAEPTVADIPQAEVAKEPATMTQEILTTESVPAPSAAYVNASTQTERRAPHVQMSDSDDASATEKLGYLAQNRRKSEARRGRGRWDKRRAVEWRQGGVQGALRL